MTRHFVLLCVLACLVVFTAPIVSSHAASPAVTGELKRWHKVTLTLAGPEADARSLDPNPFTDYRFQVEFLHQDGSQHLVPGFFAADGNAAESSALVGNKWRAYFAPDKTGRWTYRTRFAKGKHVALSDASAEPVAGCDGLEGEFTVEESDKSGVDFRAHGRLQYVGERYLRAASSGRYFLKAGPDSPENFLACSEIEGTVSFGKGQAARSGEAAPSTLKTWAPHVQDWKPGDPSWQNGKGRGIMGALNYLAVKGLTSFSFLTYNAGGDGNDVWPFLERDRKLNYHCAKLDQWQIIFEHANRLGLFCHFKTQETENDDRNGPGAAQSLDGGDTGVERKLYYRELTARFGYLLALNWNLGEENTQSTAQQISAAAYLRQVDPGKHLVVLHTYPDGQDKVYAPLLGNKSALTGLSLQNGWSAAHQRVRKWVRESAAAGHPWVVANDEQNPASLGVPPDPGYCGFSGEARENPNARPYTLHDIRRATLWGTLMAGGSGVEYYFGYELPENDLNCQDYRSRDKSWDYCRFALEFFHEHDVPFWEMQNADALVGNERGENSVYCLAKPGSIYVVYLYSGGTAQLDLEGAEREFKVTWYNPRTGGRSIEGNPAEVRGGGKVSIGPPPSEPGEDWVVLLR